MVKWGLDKDRDLLVMEWYDLYFEDLYRFIWFMIGDKQSCEDLVHDTFLRAYTAIDRFNHQSKVKTWLFSIAKHLVLDEIRKRKRRKLYSMIGLDGEIASSFNLEKHVENKELVSELVTSIQKLKPNYRVVLILKKVQECSTKEIALILNCSEAKVRKILSRAIQSLKNDSGLEGGVINEKAL